MGLLSRRVHPNRHHIRDVMSFYYALWNANEQRFKKPVPYDHSFPVSFPNIILRAKNLEEANAKINIINNRAKGIDRFDFKRKGVLPI
jgi:hypothetical protein